MARFGLVCSVVALAFATPVAIAADAGGTGGHWGRAREVAGALNTGVWASFDSIACPSAGNCAAGGEYRVRHRGQEAYVVNEVKGSWRKAEEVPGTAKLNRDTSAETMAVSCSSAGNCAAGGYYTPHTKRPLQEPFVVNEVNGHWRKAEKVPGISKMNRSVAEIESVSCSSPGNCSAGGLYSPSEALGFSLFVVNEVNGRWGRAEELPGIAAINHGDAWLESLSCASAGDCAAGGSYVDSSGRQQAFVVNEVNGRWRKVQKVPGTAELNTGGLATAYSLSCPSPGDCAATGQYAAGGANTQAFVVNEVRGHWGKAEQVPGLAKINTGDGAAADSISCASAGNCAAGGYYTGGSLVEQAFVVDERRGVWRDAKPIPGLRALNKPVEGGDGNVNAISCSSAADCAVGGTYRDAEGHVQAFLANERNGMWRRAEEVPGTARLNAGGIARIDAISCYRGGACGAGGTYSTRPPSMDTFYFEAFAVNYKPPRSSAK